MPKDLPWEEAIQKVLGESVHALHYSEIAERIASEGIRKAVGATPAATVASYLSNSLSKENSPYLRIGRGEYALKERVQNQSEISVSVLEPPSDIAETGAMRAFGMYWRRDAVIWSGTPRLLGRQGLGASEVNFASQIGVYLLHDRDRVIYVGRATDGLFTRLKAHTTDRLGGRWDRFSWFGLRGVDQSGALETKEVPWSPVVVMETMEAVLIESMEPPLNRKRGDNFSSVEYLQSDDPEIEMGKKKAVLDELMKVVERK